MELLRELDRLQHDAGFLSDEALRKLAEERHVTLYRLEGLVSFYPHFRRTPPPRLKIDVCRDVVCAMHGGGCLQRLQDQCADSDVELQEVSCLGRCDAAPAGTANGHVLAGREDFDVARIERLVAASPSQPSPETAARRDWTCDPYASPDEHYGTARALSAAGAGLAAHCIQALSQAGLRGMGGAGFPTGKKWEFVAAESAGAKYVICNADESEPGTFKDRVIMEELPHLVIEGMLLAGLSVGAAHGIIYIRHEYETARQSLERALTRARDRGTLGENAAGSGRSFDVEIFVSPGGYILGEETALLEALEDKRGEPRNKPPYPGQHGLRGRPTLINNVETFALATSIIHHGADWWSEQGVGEFAGLKFVCVSGDVERPAVFEVPVGTTVRELINLAGGTRNGHALQAFVPGGASTEFLPASAVDTPLDFEALRQAGSALGTGAVIVFDEARDLFEMATNLVRFFRNESCGKCVPCRVGSEQAVELLESVQTGHAAASALDVLPELNETLQQTSICGLGQVALAPILSMLRHFPQQVPTEQR
jgi:NADH:ubiquinone oxidoreductase subunit F (NADH-binding)/NADH:ubiquinone oxidoreductase subunit E